MNRLEVVENANFAKISLLKGLAKMYGVNTKAVKKAIENKIANESVFLKDAGVNAIEAGKKGISALNSYMKAGLPDVTAINKVTKPVILNAKDGPVKSLVQGLRNLTAKNTKEYRKYIAATGKDSKLINKLSKAEGNVDKAVDKIQYLNKKGINSMFKDLGL